MTAQEALMAIQKGRGIVSAIAHHSPCNCVGFGEMGIGNTSSASMVMSCILGQPVKDCIGRGTGVCDEQLLVKMETLEKVHAFHNLEEVNIPPLELLSKIGGFEIAQMVGAYLQAYEEKMIIMVDGFIGTAALLIARQMNTSITDNCIFAHTSSEKGHTAMLNFLKAAPLLNLGLRLGEGTGVALAIPLIQSAVNFLNEMATFETAAVNNKD
jgi:nicotinate-nucleotide--dimethylbenzimidazole phosphoribosyltransferase